MGYTPSPPTPLKAATGAGFCKNALQNLEPQEFELKILRTRELQLFWWRLGVPPPPATMICFLDSWDTGWMSHLAVEREAKETFAKLVPSAKADPACYTLMLPGTSVPGFHILPLRGWGLVVASHIFSIEWVAASKTRPCRQAQSRFCRKERDKDGQPEPARTASFLDA